MKSAIPNSNNRLQKHTYFQDISILGLSTFFNSGLAFLISVFLARNIEPESYGLFLSSIALITLFIPFAHLGITQLWLKKVGELGWEAEKIFYPSIKIIGQCLIISILTIIFWAFIGPHSDTQTYVIGVMSFHLIGFIVLELVITKYQLEGKYNQLALAQIFPNLLRIFLIAFIYSIFQNSISIYLIVNIYFLSSIIILIFFIKDIIIIARGKISLAHFKKKNNFNLKFSFWEIINESYPFALAGFFHFIYYQSDIVLVKYLASDLDAAYYGVSVLIFSATMLIPTVMYQKYLMPKIHRWINHEKKLFLVFNQKGNLFMASVGMIFFLLIILNSHNIILTFFGLNYFNSIEILEVLSFAIPVVFVSANLGSSLGSRNMIKKKAKIMGFVAIINIFLNISLIPKLGSIGAAYATLASNIVLLALYAFQNYKLVSKIRREISSEK